MAKGAYIMMPLAHRGATQGPYRSEKGPKKKVTIGGFAPKPPAFVVWDPCFARQKYR